MLPRLFAWTLAGLSFPPIAAAATEPTVPPAPITAVLRAAESVPGLTLPLNRVFLYRETAFTLASMQGQGPAATLLLKRALQEIDAAEATERAQGSLTEAKFAQLEFARRPVLLLMVGSDAPEALRLLNPPQTADTDTEFQRLVFEAVARHQLSQVNEAAETKLAQGVTPAAVAAYAVLAKRDSDAAKLLAASIVQRLSKSEPAQDPIATQAALAMLRLLRIDEGTRAPSMLLDPHQLDDPLVKQLFQYIARALVASPDPELLILPETPQLYLRAIREFAPDEADAVAALPFAAPNAKSLLFSPAPPVATADQQTSDPAASSTPVPEEEQKRREALRQQFMTTLSDTADRLTELRATIDATKDEKTREKALSDGIREANDAIAMARTLDPLLPEKSFLRGELVFYDAGPAYGIVRGIAAFLRHYAATDLDAARRAARTLDGPEIETYVTLQLETSALVRR